MVQPDNSKQKYGHPDVGCHIKSAKSIPCLVNPKQLMMATKQPLALKHQLVIGQVDHLGKLNQISNKKFYSSYPKHKITMGQHQEAYYCCRESQL